MAVVKLSGLSWVKLGGQKAEAEEFGAQQTQSISDLDCFGPEPVLQVILGLSSHRPVMEGFVLLQALTPVPWDVKSRPSSRSLIPVTNGDLFTYHLEERF